MRPDSKHYNFILPAVAAEVVEADIAQLDVQITEYFRVGSGLIHGLVTGKYKLHATDGSQVHIVMNGRDNFVEIGSSVSLEELTNE